MFLILSIPYFFPEALMPAALTEGHQQLQCEDCHVPWIGAQDSKCSSCHEEKNIQWHNNHEFPSKCQSCHKLHVNEYDKHELNCLSCHEDEHEGVDFDEDDCLTCHIGPDEIEFDYTHQNSAVEKISNKDKHTKNDNECFLCHDLGRFDEYNCLTSDCHGTSKYDEKHDEEVENWRGMDCFEAGCHSNANNRGDFYNYSEYNSMAIKFKDNEIQSSHNIENYFLILILFIYISIVIFFFHYDRMLRS